MPLYNFKCKKCDHEEEFLVKLDLRDQPTACSKCGAKKLERLIGATSFQLKGGGWYKDLYSSVPKKANKNESK